MREPVSTSPGGRSPDPTAHCPEALSDAVRLAVYASPTTAIGNEVDVIIGASSVVTVAVDAVLTAPWRRAKTENAYLELGTRSYTVSELLPRRTTPAASPDDEVRGAREP